MTVNENDQKNITRMFNVMTDGVKWLEKYGNGMERIFKKLPKFLSSFISTLAIVTFGATLRGEWTIIFVMLWKQLGLGMFSNDNQTLSYSELSLKTLKMENFSYFFISSMIVSYLVYFTVGGFLHWYFYVQRKDTPHEWKIQPEKWLPVELELHEIMVGCTALLCTGAFSGALGCYIANGNPSQVYFQFDGYGWWWFFLQIPVIFIYQDYTTYCLHRLYHTPFLYKHFHKLHHKYKQPTAFSVTAIHPVEIIHVQLTMCLPLFVIPTHWVAFYGVALYTYYHGIIDHSGINFKGQWWQPWQPDAEFHDKHHQLFHVNYSFNIKYWDTLHGTDVRKNRVYTEETFECVKPIIKNEDDEVNIKKTTTPDQNGNIYNKKVEQLKNGHVGNGHMKES